MATPVVEEAAQPKKKRMTTLKGLAKKNAKATDWISKKLDMSAEVAHEKNLVEMRDDEIVMEADQANPEMIERMAKRDRQQEAWRCRRMIKEMVHNLIESVPALSSTMNVLDVVLETALLRVKVNAAWRILEDDRRVQRIMTWRMDIQKQDEQLLQGQDEAHGGQGGAHGLVGGGDD